MMNDNFDLTNSATRPTKRLRPPREDADKPYRDVLVYTILLCAVIVLAAVVS